MSIIFDPVFFGREFADYVQSEKVSRQQAGDMTKGAVNALATILFDNGVSNPETIALMDKFLEAVSARWFEHSNVGGNA